VSPPFAARPSAPVADTPHPRPRKSRRSTERSLPGSQASGAVPSEIRYVEVSVDVFSLESWGFHWGVGTSAVPAFSLPEPGRTPHGFDRYFHSRWSGRDRGPPLFLRALPSAKRLPFPRSPTPPPTGHLHPSPPLVQFRFLHRGDNGSPRLAFLSLSGGGGPLDTRFCG